MSPNKKVIISIGILSLLYSLSMRATKKAKDYKKSRDEIFRDVCKIKKSSTDAEICENAETIENSMYGNAIANCSSSFKVPKHSLEQLFYDDDFKIIACVPTKTGTSSWQRSFGSLKTATILENEPHVKVPPMEFNNSQIFKAANRLSKLPYDVALHKLRSKSYTKVAHVRNPFSRLYSAWRQKFRKGHETLEFFMKKYGSKIREKYKDEGTETHEIKFENFLRYVAETKNDRKFDVHWNTYQFYCTPCDILYDVISKTETQDVDMETIFKKQKFKNSNFSAYDFIGQYLPKQYKDSPMKKNTLPELYKQVPSSLVQELVKIYYWDFKLFGYSTVIE